ncbi:unnamed protein product [Cuscuta campestris]|uniref:Nuclear pore complex protein NUP1 n=1 Tax=Cuscuta campestris TaxID=132261 RepID=A0A484LBL9_9ASTE|nr:unnamed protein product [Cuscuta campestris]
MEANTSTAAAIYNDGEQHRGAGGKFKKPSSRKPPPSPYARPLAAPVNKAGSGGWLSKLVDPAYRLISGTATRIIPSFLSRATSDALPLLPITTSNEGEEVIPSAKDEEKCTSTSAAFVSSVRMDANELIEKENGISQDQNQGHDRPENSHDDSEISRIEQLMKGKSFSREEIIHLTELLKARATDDLEKDKSSMISGRDSEGVLFLHGTPRKPTESTEDVNRVLRGPLTPLPQTKVKDEIGASPIDVAKAYMGSRMADQSPSHRSFLSKGQQDPENAYKNFVPPPLPKPSPCWPGTMASERNQGLNTPQNQRSRYGLHDFPRTPYSRTLLSKSRTNSRGLDFSLQSSQQSPMSARMQERAKTAVFDQGYGSVGPIRRIRNKLGTEPRPKKSIFLNPSKAASEIEKSLVPKTFLPSLTKNKEIGHAGETSKTVQNEASRIILEHISRHKPTPKEKAYELNLATSHARPSENADLKRTELGSTKSLKGENSDKGTVQRNFGDSSLDVSNSNAGPSSFSADSQLNIFFPPSSIPNSYKNSLTDIVPRETPQNRSSFLQQQSNGQNASSTSTLSDPAGPNPEKETAPHSHTSGTKPNLTAIAINKPDLRNNIFSNSTTPPIGFTFPVPATSGALSEPPTPSMPSSSAAKIALSDDTLPSFSFGNGKSSRALVFSFPSTSSLSAPADATDAIKFNFGGGDGKTRLCFNAAVC